MARHESCVSSNNKHTTVKIFASVSKEISPIVAKKKASTVCSETALGGIKRQKERKAIAKLCVTRQGKKG